MRVSAFCYLPQDEGFLPQDEGELPPYEGFSPQDEGERFICVIPIQIDSILGSYVARNALIYKGFVLIYTVTFR